MSRISGKTTLRDVAREANVDVATASRALSDAPTRPVTEKTAARVRAAAHLLGYQPDEAARSLRTKRSRAIGVLIANMANPIMPPMVQGAEHVLAEHGYTTLFADTANSQDAQTSRIAALQAWRLAGLILATGRRTEPLPDALIRSGTPVVMLSRTIDDVMLSSATADEGSGLSEAVRHLREFGHSRIAYIGAPLWNSIGYEKLQAYREQLIAQELLPAPELEIIPDGWAEQDGYTATRQLLAIGNPPTAILCGNDSMALGALRAISDAGLHCPRDISVIGYHDMPLVDRIDPPLTTIRVPYYDMGAAAARLLIDQIENPGESPRAVKLRLQLVPRGTTGSISR